MAADIIRRSEATPETGSVPTRPFHLRYIRFGPIQVDQLRQEISNAGSRLRLQGKVYQILLALIEKQGEVVTRDELRVRLWPADTHVNYDANVNTTMNKLRHALGDSSDKPLYIKTIPRKGYVFIARPQVSDRPDEPFVSDTGHTNASDFIQFVTRQLRLGVNSDFPLIAYIVGFVLIGVLFGAGIRMAAWISFHRPGPS